MYHLFAALAEFNRSYTEQLNFFETYSSDLVNRIKKRADGTISGNQDKEDLEESQVQIFEFPKIPPHKTQTHSEEKDDIVYMDFPHHNILNEGDYREYSGKQLDEHIKEITEIYQKNLRIVTHNFPRYIRRYWRFIDEYITLLEKLYLLRKNKFDIKQDGNVYSPYTLSEERREYDSTRDAINKMEERWKNEKSILKNGLENIYRANLVTERYWSMMAYFSSPEKQFTEAQIILDKIILDNTMLLGIIHDTENISPEFYKQKSIDELRGEHENVRKNIGNKNTPRS